MVYPPHKPDTGHGEHVGTEAVVEREPGQHAEEQGTGRVDHQGADRQRVESSQAEVVDEQRAQDGTGAARQCDQQGEAEGGGGGAHEADQPPAHGMAGHDECQASGHGGGQVGQARGDVAVLGQEGGFDGQRGIGRPSPRKPMRRSGRSTGTRCETCSVSGIRSPMANEPLRFTSSVTQGKPPAAAGWCTSKQVAGQGAERTADEDGRQGGR